MIEIVTGTEPSSTPALGPYAHAASADAIAVSTDALTPRRNPR
jgi:hypothetical protein